MRWNKPKISINFTQQEDVKILDDVRILDDKTKSQNDLLTNDAI